MTDEDTGKDAKDSATAPKADTKETADKKPARAAGTAKAKSAAAKRPATKRASTKKTSTPRRTAAASAKGADVKTPKTETPKPAAAKGETAAASGAAPPQAAATPPAPPPRPSYSPPPPPASPPPRSMLGGTAGMALIVSGIAVVLALTTPEWGPRVWGEEGTAAETEVTDAEEAVLQQTVAALQARVEELSSSQEGLARSIDVVKLPGMLIVAKDLRDDLGSSEPFAENLNLLRAIVGEEESGLAAVFALDDWAEIGVPTEAELRDGFDDVAHAIVAAEQKVAADGDLASKVSETMANLSAVTTRLRWKLDGAPTGEGPSATVARAEALVATLAFGDAIEQLKTLPDDLQALTEDWAAAVNARAALETAREELDVYMIEAVARTR